LWLDRKRALRNSDVQLVQALDAALETVWELKRLVRVDVKARRTEAAAKLKEFWKERRDAKALPLAA
jgi:hypothetical protein